MLWLSTLISLITLYQFIECLSGYWISIFPLVFLSTMAIEKLLIKQEYESRENNAICRISRIERKSKDNKKEIDELKDLNESLLK